MIRPTKSWARRRTMIATVLIATAPAPAPLGLEAQGLAKWTVTSEARIDLWYHGLAVVGFEGFAPLRLYSEDYAARVREAKEAEGLFPTALDRERIRFRTAFARDSVYEVFHFLPLYFSTRPEAMLATLGEVARGEEPVELGGSIAASVFRKKEQRQFLGTFVDALREEWEVFLEAYRDAPERAARRAQVLEAAEAMWDRELSLALFGFLGDRRLDGGVAVVSPALGPEGRIFAGDADDRTDNLVAVGLADGAGDPAEVVFRMVREMCYPLVSRRVAASALPRGDRVTAERMSSRGAVRCGAMLLEAQAPGLAAAYRASFVRAARLDPERVTFEDAFPADPGLLEHIRRDLRLR